MKALIVLPSYNERANIVRLVEAILAEDPEFRVCVVDDSSPDGTAQELEAARASREAFRDRVHLIVRRTKDGRGGAVRAGFEWGWQRGGFDAFVEMDCDFSHEPRALREGLSLLRQGYDVVIGARYPDGTIEGWPLSRHVFSFLANRLTRLLIDASVADYTNGFRFYRPRAAELILQHPQQHKGYIYLSETLSHLLRSGVRIGSFPTYFKNRERGVSNTSLREISAALRGIFSIAKTHHFGGR